MPASRTLQSRPLGIEVRAALDLIATWARAWDPREVRLIGRADLIEEFRRYLPFPEDPQAPLLIALGASPPALREIVTTTAPTDVTILAAAPLARLIRRLRTDPISLERDLPASIWRALGYRLAACQGIQGIGSLGWACAQVLAQRLDHLALADRCRIAMLRTLLVCGSTGRLSTLCVRSYRRGGRR